MPCNNTNSSLIPRCAAIDFFESCVPPTTTAQTKRVNHKTGVFFKDKRGEAAQATYDAILFPHRPAQPVSGPVRLTIMMCWPWRMSESKRRRALGSVPHTSKPDIDNAIKTLIDRLVAFRFIEADQAVCDLYASKRWGDHPGIRVRIESLTESGGDVPCGTPEEGRVRR